MFWKSHASHSNSWKYNCYKSIDCDKLNDVISGWFEGKKIVGDPDDNFLKGSWGDDMIVANAGADLIFGLLGDDTILANDGNDTVYGGLGDDLIYAGNGNDVVDGGCGDDFISGDRGTDTLTGGKGDDVFQLNVGKLFLGDSLDTITDFRVGSDRLELLDGDKSLVTFEDTGNDISVFYDGVQVAILENVRNIPSDTDVLFT